VLHAPNLADLPAAIAGHLFTFDAAVVAATWVSALLGALITFLHSPYHGMAHTPANFVRYLTPPGILKSRSVRLDLWYALASRVVHPAVISPFMVGNIVIAKLSYDALANQFGPVPALPQTWPEYIVILLVTIIVADFWTFFWHWAEHKAGVLWELHKVHHSTLLLLPISNRRIHPLQEIIDAGSVMVGVGVWIGTASYLFHLPITENLALGVDAYFLANLLSFYHLRHSHIPMSYGKLEWWLMSPAQHQLHHSVEERHWDKNFGLFLSIWDRIWGTLLLSEPQGGFRLGLPGVEGRSYDSLVKLYLVPPLRIVQRVGRGLAHPWRTRPQVAVAKLMGDETSQTPA
jgi:sterol desaturase/sphingolipid hydroxylase (fatty acid hydroxylase superfamily)